MKNSKMKLYTIIHVQIDTIYDCTFAVQNNVLWSYLLACIILVWVTVLVFTLKMFIKGTQYTAI